MLALSGSVFVGDTIICTQVSPALEESHLRKMDSDDDSFPFHESDSSITWMYFSLNSAY